MEYITESSSNCPVETKTDTSTEASWSSSTVNSPSSGATDSHWVSPAVPLESQTIELCIIDQAVVRAYSTYILCFPKDDATPKQETYEYLREGLSRTLAQVPTLASKIFVKDAVRGTLELRIEPGAGIRLGFRDLTGDDSDSSWPAANYQDLQAAAFPPSTLQNEALGFTPSPEPYPSDHVPVFVAQVAFLQHGLLLCCAISHQVADVTGTEAILKIWSQNTADAAAGCPLTISKEIHNATMDRSRLDQGIRNPAVPDWPWPTRIADDVTEPVWQGDLATTPKYEKDPSPSMIWYIEPESIKTLKRISQPLVDGGEHWISTLDALQALLWRQVSKARCLNSKNTNKTTLYFVCDVRKLVVPPIQEDSVCNVTIKTFVDHSLQLFERDLTTSLRHTALAIRQTIRSLTEAKFLHWIGFLQSAPTTYSLQPRERLEGGPDMVVTDHSKVSPYALNWGPVGKIDCWRKLWWSRSNAHSQCIIMPQLPNGGLEIMTNFEHEINDRLRADQELNHFLQFRCM